MVSFRDGKYPGHIWCQIHQLCKSNRKINRNISKYNFLMEDFIAILGLQPRDKAAMLVVNAKEIFLLNLHQNRVHFPVERNAFVLDHQHGRRDVTCKPAIKQLTIISISL